MTLYAALEAALGSAPIDSQPVGGGDIGESARVVLGDGRTLFVKRYPGVPSPSPDAPPIAVAEARGLAWLAEARAEASGAVPMGVGALEPWHPGFARNRHPTSIQTGITKTSFGEGTSV